MSLVKGAIRVIVARNSDQPDTISAFARFRKRLFVDTFGWELKTHGDSECDQFDTPNAEYAVMVCCDRIVGGFRAIRTDHDYLACSVFPHLASRKAYPRRRDIWEISRFGVAREEPCSASHNLALLNYSLMFRFARLRGATALVALADRVYERYLRTLGIRTRRYGPPQKIGQNAHGQVLVCVAGEIPIREQFPPRMDELVELTSGLEIHDAVVQRSEAISA
jgi:N-acyl-L-homoserine lactone synthetase